MNANVGAITVKVTASDGSLSASDTFTLTVINTNADPTAVTLSATAIDENDTGGVVGDLTTTDDDNINGDSHTYTLSGTDAASFEITASGVLKLKDSVTANYENQNSYSVTVTATDSHGNDATDTFRVTVKLLRSTVTSGTNSSTVSKKHRTSPRVWNPSKSVAHRDSQMRRVM